MKQLLLAAAAAATLTVAAVPASAQFYAGADRVVSGCRLVLSALASDRPTAGMILTSAAIAMPMREIAG
jgi:hypothetical protein